jgi:hypothetical protein
MPGVKGQGSVEVYFLVFCAGSGAKDLTPEKFAVMNHGEDGEADRVAAPVSLLDDINPCLILTVHHLYS